MKRMKFKGCTIIGDNVQIKELEIKVGVGDYYNEKKSEPKNTSYD